MKKIESFELVDSFGLISLEEAEKINGGASIGTCEKEAKVLYPIGNIPVPTGNYISLEPLPITLFPINVVKIPMESISGNK